MLFDVNWKNTGFAVLEKTRLPLNTNVMYAIKLDNPLKSSELKFKKLDLGNILSFSASSGGLSLNHDLGFSKGYIKLGIKNEKITGLTITGKSKLPLINKELALGARID